MVEFALVLPVLLVVLFGIIQFGLTLRNYVTLTDAVRAGARTAAVSRLLQPGARTTAIDQKIQSASSDLSPSIASSDITITSTWQYGDDVSVTATYPYSISLFGVVIASGNLSSTTTERVE